jgi:hypothetical protein
MANKVQITVTVNGSAVASQLAAINTATKAATDNQKSSWDSLGSHVGSVFKGFGGLAAGALAVGLTGPLAAAGLAIGAFGAVAAPTLDKVDKALTSTGKAGQQAWANLDPAQRGLAESVKGLETEFGALTTKLEPVVTQVLGLAVHTAGDLIPAIGGLAKAGATVIDGFLTPFDKLLQSTFFAQFVTQMSSLATQVAPVLGQSLTGLLKVFMQLFMQAGPAAVQVLNQLLPVIVQIVGGLVPFVTAVTKITAATLEWLANNRLLIPALIAVGAAMAIAGGSFTVLIAGLALVVGGLTHLWQTSQTFRDVVTTAFSVVGRAVLSLAEMWLTEMQVISNIFLTTVGIIIHGAADAFGWVPGVGGKLKSAAAAFDGFKADVNNVFDAAHAKIEGWKTDLANMPKKVALQGDISDLTAKLNDAKAQLKDPNLTATRRAQIEANISQLQSQLASARGQLAALNGYTVNTYIVTNQIIHTAGSQSGVPFKASGGIIGAAGGGPRSNLVMVGEQGPELVRLPTGSTVHSNPDTQAMLGAAGGQFHITLELGDSFRQAGLSAQQLEDIRYTVRTKGGRGPDAVAKAFGQS